MPAAPGSGLDPGVADGSAVAPWSWSWPALAFWSPAAAGASASVWATAWRSIGRVATARLVPTATASTASALATSTSCLRRRRWPADGPDGESPGCLSRVGADMTAPLLAPRACGAASPQPAPGRSRSGGLLGTLRSRSCHRSATSTGVRRLSRATGRRRRSAAAAARPG